jgi:hypothetical protein
MPPQRCPQAPRNARRIRGFLLGAFLVPAAARAQGTEFTLRDALDRAATAAVANRTARAARDESAAAQLGAWRAILPTIRVDAGVLRTTDPVGAFGTTLRQQRITAGDFDPARLNFPEPINNFTGALASSHSSCSMAGWPLDQALAASMALPTPLTGRP